MRSTDRSTLRALSILLAPALAFSACGGGSDADEAAPSTGPEVVRTTVGDTAVVRTVAGSVWGGAAELVPEVSIGVLDGDENYMLGMVRSIAVDDAGRIFAMDAQSLELRVFGADGTWLANWGRDGEGPGEFGQPDGGLTVLSDGRIVVRDPGNARFQVFSAAGEPLDTWPVIRGGFNTSSPFARKGDTILTSQVVNLGEASVMDWRSGYVRISPEGEIVDTLDFPDVGYEPPRIEASREGSTSVNSVPWSADEHVAWHPDGFFIHGIAEEYAFTLLREGSPLRIERAYQPIPIQSGERALREETTTRNMRGTDPNWRWNGPAIPDDKPPYADLATGTDGRIWVLRNGEAYPYDDPDFDPSDPEDIEVTFREDYTWDVFESDGTYLGEVAMPREFSRYPDPIFGTEHVWAITRDEFDVQRIVRYRIEVPSGD